MPAAAAVLIRGLIQAIVTTGILTAVQAWLIPLLNRAIQEVSKFFGCTEEEAKDIIANEYLQFAETAGVLLLTLRAKTPTLIAERLGFTSKGFVLRKLSPTLASKVGTVAKVSTIGTVATTAEVAVIAKEVATNRGISASVVSSVYNNILKAAGLTTAIFFAAAQYIDFANWEGPYQGTFQKLMGYFGLEADKPNPKARTISNDVWTKIYSTVEELQPETIAFPWLDVVRPYTRQNLSDAVDHFAANISVQGRATSFKDVFAVLLPCIKLKGKTNVGVGTSTGGITVPKVQVFSGVLSQGFLGDGVAFQARENDMIDSPQELVDSAGVNLAPFLSGLARRVQYELKIVPTVTSKDGFTQRGTSVRVVSSYTQKGEPRYKTITNKFAVLELFLLNDKGTRVKINTIVLGPVNALNFQVTQDALTAVTNALKGVVTTTNIEDVKGISTVLPVTITTPNTTVPKITAPTVPVGTVTPVVIPTLSAPAITPAGPHYVIGIYGSKETWTDDTLNNIKRAYPNGPWYELTKEQWDSYGTPNQNTSSATITGLPVKTTQTTTTPAQPVTTAPPAQRAGASASTLAEWYTANGKSLPTISTRSVLYQDYGLGSSAIYVGSAEQNLRLLEKLKGF